MSRPPKKEKLSSLFLQGLRFKILLAHFAMQCALPGLNRGLQITVGIAGPQPRAPDLSEHCQTSTANSRSQWALPDLNGELQITVGIAGPQPRAPDLSEHCRTSTASSRSQRALPDLNGELQITVGVAGPARPHPKNV